MEARVLLGKPDSEERPGPFVVGCGYFLAVSLTGLMLTIDGVSASRAFRQIRAAGYPTVTGVMLKSEVGIYNDDDSTGYSPIVQYSYSVAGKRYVGNQYRYGREESNDKEWAMGIVAWHPVGSQVEVHYSPTDPNDPVLLVGLPDLISGG
jgi:hypothetical protein